MRLLSVSLALTMCLALILFVMALASNPTPADAAEPYDQNGCLMCHASPDIQKGEKSLTVTAEGLQASAHRALDCLDCHQQPDEVAEAAGVLSDTYVHSKEDQTGWQHNAVEMNKLSTAEKCGSCHGHQYELYEESAHGRHIVADYQEGASEGELQAAKDSAGCLDCHSTTANAHDIIRVLDIDSSAYHKNIPDTCGECHGDETMMKRYGLKSYVYEGYQKDFHGKAVMIESYKVEDRMAATCADCHGSHKIDPARVITVQGTCGQCHEVPTEDEARMLESWMGHTEPSSDHFPVVYYITWVYRILVPAVLLFGASHVILAFLKWLRSHGETSE